MTQKEKAASIVESYQNIQMLKDFGGMDLEIAKECAKIHVNGIIESKPHLPNNYLITLKYWYEVLEEIDKL